jgi:hypothetical protein
MSGPAKGVLAVLEETSAGLWSVANSASTDLATAMRIRCEQFDEARAAAADAVAALREARRWIGDGDMSDGMDRSIWTPAYAAVVDQVDAAIARMQGGAA